MVTRMIVRVDPDLKTKVSSLAKSEGKVSVKSSGNC